MTKEVHMVLLRYKSQELDRLDDTTTVDELAITKEIFAAFLGCKACDIDVQYVGRVPGGRRVVRQNQTAPRAQLLEYQ